MWDFEACLFNFLWVRWYEVVNSRSLGWNKSILDLVCFPLIHEDNSFGFVDPDDLLQWCYILLAFAQDKRRETNIDISHCAKDSNASANSDFPTACHSKLTFPIATHSRLL